MGFVIVFLGAGIGGGFRHAMNLAISGPLGTQFPHATLAVNVLGSFLMGVIAEYFAFKSGLSEQWRLFLTTGILGGFTTFSAFSLEAALLYERGRTLLALLYMGSSLGVGVGALFAGLFLVRHFVGGVP
jgi:CrcB protein